MTKTIAIVQARMGSQRFPGKSLVPVWNDVTLIELALMRIARTKNLDEVVLATSDTSIDDPLAQAASELGIPVFRGDEQDVLKRFYDAVHSHPADVIVRICGDNPLVDPAEIDRLVTFFQNSQPCEYACNDRLDCGLPDGAGAEVFSYVTLMRLNREVSGKLREHVSLYVTQHLDEFSVARLEAEGRLRRPDIRLDVDYPEDANFVRQLIARLDPSDAPFWDTSTVVAALEKNPELFALRKQRREAAPAAHGS